jgi:hypothetical protein
VETGDEGSPRSEAAHDEETKNATRNKIWSTHRVIV